MPVLIMTPLMSADTCDGAAGCASGSQTCSGTIPAFVPKPTSARMKAAPAARPPAAPRREKSRRTQPLPPRCSGRGSAPAHTQQEEQGDQERGADLGGHQVGDAGLPHALLLVVNDNEEPGREGHDLPGDEEEHSVPRQTTTRAMLAARMQKASHDRPWEPPCAAPACPRAR